LSNSAHKYLVYVTTHGTIPDFIDFDGSITLDRDEIVMWGCARIGWFSPWKPLIIRAVVDPNR
jgi:hypothetical protein